jgi:hypothetical protein
MYAVGNFEKFIDDHPELPGRREEILAKVQEHACKKLQLVSGAVPDQVFDPHWAQVFHEEIMNSEAHISIMLRAMGGPGI